MAISVMNWVWTHSRSRHGTRLVLLAIADCGEVADISVPQLAHKTLLSERAVQVAIRELMALGELAVGYGGGRGEPNRYRVLMIHREPLPLPASTGRTPVPDKIRSFVFKRDGHQCIRCGSTDDLTIDHIYPRSLGGSDTEENLQTLCRPCNSSKGARV